MNWINKLRRKNSSTEYWYVGVEKRSWFARSRADRWFKKYSWRKIRRMKNDLIN